MILAAYCTKGHSAIDPFFGTLAAADFAGGHYSLGGVTSSAAAMIDKPELIEAEGLMIQWDTIGGAVFAIGDFLSTLLTVNWTMVIEWAVAADGTGNIFPFAIGVAGTRKLWVADDNFSTYVHDDVSNAGFDDIVEDAPPRQHRMAFTVTPTKLAASIDGEDTDSHGGDHTQAGIDDAVIGSDSFDTWANFSGHIRSIIIWPAKEDAELPALSTL